MEKPEPFIQITEEGGIRLEEKALQFLQGIQVPVTVIALIGKYRTGKSFLLNRFYGERHGFPVGGSVQSMTKGIWLWARPHPFDPSRFLILLDTEGLHDVEKNNAVQDIQIFSLALLLSSCCIYNAVGTIDDVLIQQLNLVVDLTEHIHIRPDDEEEDGNQFSKYFPSLVVILRDFFLDLKIGEEPCSPDEYLENALKLKKGPDRRSRKLKNYNMPRECIRTFFPRRKCFTLPRPVNDVNKLVKMDQVPAAEMNPEFLSSCNAAVNQILEETKDFEVEGFVMTGPRYAHLIQTYADTMNTKHVPCISNAVSQLQQSQCQLGLDEAVGVFDDHMTTLLKDRLPVSLDELETASNAAHAVAIEHFKKKALFDKEGRFFMRLSEALNANFKTHLNQNATKSQYNCRQALMRSFAAVESNIKTERYHIKEGYQMYLQDKAKAIAEYESTPNKGPLGSDELQNYLEKKHSTEDTILGADQAISSKERAIEMRRQEIRRQEEREKRQQENNKRMAKEILLQQEANQEILSRLQDAYQQQSRKYIEDQARDIEEKNLELQYFRDHGLERQIQEYEEIIHKMVADKDTMQTDYEQEQEKIGKLSKEHAEIMKELREKREFDEDQLRKFQRSMDSRWTEEKSQDGGITGWIGSLINGTIDWLYGTGNTDTTGPPTLATGGVSQEAQQATGGGMTSAGPPLSTEYDSGSRPTREDPIDTTQTLVSPDLD